MPGRGIDLRQGKGDRPERARIAVQFKAEPVATGEEVEVDDGVRAALGKQRLPPSSARIAPPSGRPCIGCPGD